MRVLSLSGAQNFQFPASDTPLWLVEFYTLFYTLELDTFNPDRLIWISNVESYNFLLIPLFFSHRQFYTMNCAQNLKFPGFSDCWTVWVSPNATRYWLSYLHFCRYKLKIKLILILTKREDQALISIFTILKFSAQSRIYF